MRRQIQLYIHAQQYCGNVTPLNHQHNRRQQEHKPWQQRLLDIAYQTARP